MTSPHDTQEHRLFYAHQSINANTSTRWSLPQSSPIQTRPSMSTHTSSGYQYCSSEKADTNLIQYSFTRSHTHSHFHANSLVRWSLQRCSYSNSAHTPSAHAFARPYRAASFSAPDCAPHSLGSYHTQRHHNDDNSNKSGLGELEHVVVAVVLQLVD